ncbi:hypothetical protein ACFTSF_22675 [Kribbella sp. NPDC056951]|uniref:hypothetical protein n=1 Tax=Kribbella sp. NPDC056951 TaxID=3345978 RepID=UPI003630460C
MNLTIPPPVEQLDPGYATDLKYNLVRKARKRRRTPSWTPILAAACGIAIITTGVVYLSHTGDSTADPAGSTGIVQVPADESMQIPLNSIPAPTKTEIRAAARQCMTPKLNAIGHPNHLEKPAAADTANFRTATWLSLPDATGRRDSKRLLQTFTTRDSNMWYQCLDGELLHEGNVVDNTLSPQNLVPGTWGWSTTKAGSKSVAHASYSFRAHPSVVLVELRIRGAKGASGWFTVMVEDTSGYVEGALENAVAEHGAVEVDIRALDKSGKQIWFKTFG